MSEWLEYRSQVTGKPVEQIREEMRQISLKADKSKSGFASMSKKKLEQVQQKARQTRLKNKNGLRES